MHNQSWRCVHVRCIAYLGSLPRFPDLDAANILCLPDGMLGAACTIEEGNEQKIARRVDGREVYLSMQIEAAALRHWLAVIKHGTKGDPLSYHLSSRHLSHHLSCTALHFVQLLYVTFCQRNHPPARRPSRTTKF